MAQPVLYVLAGVNGAGKSSIGGFLLAEQDIPWFNPDAFARELIAACRCDQEEANAAAWKEGLRRLDEAVTRDQNHAFETTLGGHTMADRILAATRTHDVIIWFFGLSTPEDHIRRVAARVKAGGHDIPEARIKDRYPRAQQNLIALMPHVASLRVYDNSVEAGASEPVPDPMLVLEMERGHIVFPRPDDGDALAATPDWAKPLVEAAIAG